LEVCAISTAGRKSPVSANFENSSPRSSISRATAQMIEGGDVLVLGDGRRVLVGMNRHTNEEGFRKLTAALTGSGIEVIKIPHRALHLDCCLAPLPDRSALCAAVKLPDASVDTLKTCFVEMIPLDPVVSSRVQRRRRRMSFFDGRGMTSSSWISRNWFFCGAAFGAWSAPSSERKLRGDREAAA